MTIYMDNASTTPTRKEVLDAMIPYLMEEYGNPASIHSKGKSARDAVDQSRLKLAHVINASPAEIYLTSGGTESDNWALKSCVVGRYSRGKHIIVSSIEHHAVLNSCHYLEEQGIDITYLPVDTNGLVNPESVEDAIRPDTALISVMAANNEIGTIQPIREIGKIAHDHNILFHTDAVQAYGHINVDVKRDNIDLLSASSHKIGGPKGIGLLYIRNGIKLDPLIHGGEQERGMRGGTTNVAGAVGFGCAAEIAEKEMSENNSRMINVRDHIISRILSEIPYSHLNGDWKNRLPGNINVRFDFVEGEGLLMSMNMSGILVSTGSACASGSLDPSHVLLGIGLKHEEAHGSIRISISERTDLESADRAVDALKTTVERLRSLSPLYDDYLRRVEKAGE